MADPAGSDKFLLERLNALKPTSISLDPPPKSVPASTIEKTQPLSKEDALSDRLKSLRSQIDSESPSSSSSGLHESHSDAASPSVPATKSAQPHTSGTDHDVQVDHGASRNSITGGAAEGREDVDPLLETDDQTLEELLADLGSDQAWLDEVAAEEEEEHRRVMALLEGLGKASSVDNLGQEDAASREATRVGPEGHSDDGSDDDSEGHQMTREADDVLAKALDEVELEKSRQPISEASPPAKAPALKSELHSEDDIPPNPPTGPSDSFKLPGVPSQLQDQPTIAHDDDDDLSETDAAFESSIAARMAALKVSSSSPDSSSNNPVLPSVPASDVNALGLPGAPTFAPHDRPVPGLLRRPTRFTDEDQRSWCIVCLEDGAIRCLGCEEGDDIYCARCWKEMHVGPRAGYDERGHRWEKYVRGR